MSIETGIAFSGNAACKNRSRPGPTGPTLLMRSTSANSAIRPAVLPSVTPSISTSADAMPHWGCAPSSVRSITATGRLPV